MYLSDIYLGKYLLLHDPGFNIHCMGGITLGNWQKQREVIDGVRKYYQ